MTTKPKCRRGTADTGPTFCHHCNKQLMRVGGSTGHYFFHLALHKPSGQRVRIHGDCWPHLKDEQEYKLIPKPTT